jgi:hypothetical protein
MTLNTLSSVVFQSYEITFMNSLKPQEPTPMSISHELIGAYFKSLQACMRDNERMSTLKSYVQGSG